jgi:C1q domain.
MKVKQKACKPYYSKRIAKGSSSSKIQGKCMKRKRSCHPRKMRNTCSTIPVPLPFPSNNTLRSAFRATSNQFQTILSTQVPQVIYSQEEFDYGKEYNPATSTFTPKQNGVYSFTASVLYAAEPVTTVAVTLAVLVNDSPQLSVIQTLSSGRGVVLATGIVRLSKGDKVQVVIQANADGFISPSTGTRFEGFRVR